MRRLWMGGLILALGMGPALAADLVETGRYVFVAVEGGALRLDKESGEVSRCAEEEGRMLCRLVPDDRLAYAAKIERLDERLLAVEARLARLEEEAVAPAPAEPVPDAGEGPGPELGGEAETESEEGAEPEPPAALSQEEEEELDRFLALTDKVMRRFFGLVQELKRDFEKDQL